MEPGKKGKLHSKNTAKHPLESTARPVPDSNGKQSLEGPIKPTENNEKLLLPNSFKQPTDTNNLKLSNKMFQDLLTNVYDLFTVEQRPSKDPKKNQFPSLFNAMMQATSNTQIKINTGLYTQRIQIKHPNIRLQASEPTTNAVLVTQQYAEVIIDLPRTTDKTYFQYLKFAHLAQQAKELLQWPSLEELKGGNYRRLKIVPNINTIIHVKRGTLQIDECKLSLATQKDPKRLVAAIIVEEEGTLLVSRTEILGAAGTIGIYCNGGKVALRETIFKEHAIGVLVNGSKLTSIIAKNCIFQRCVHGVVLNGPYAGSVQSSIITASDEIGIHVLGGNASSVATNEITGCRVGIQIQNSCPKIIKNKVTKSREPAVRILSRMSHQCWPILKFNLIEENFAGGIQIAGPKNASLLSLNTIKNNKCYGVKVQDQANPHIFMNEVTDTLGNGIHIGKRSTAFIEKNTISGSLNCNVVFEGPENLNNYLYNNKILKARGHGIFVIHGESFLIAKNEISQNYNGIFSCTSVVRIEENSIVGNKCNGVMLVHDNEVSILFNIIKDNCMAGVVSRNTSRASILFNVFDKNQFDIVAEQDHALLAGIQEQNEFLGAYDLRVPRNYQCLLI